MGPDVCHRLFIENYHNGVDNTQILLGKRIMVCGTIEKLVVERNI